MDDRIDDILREEARDYNAPPATPRDAMWERIAMERAAVRDAARRAAEDATPIPGVTPLAPQRTRPIVARPLRIAIGIAAVLLLGVAVGREMERRSHTPAPGIAQTTPPAAITPDSVSAPVVTPPSVEERRNLVSAPQRAGGGSVPALNASAPERSGAGTDVAYQMALSQHLSQSEAFLTLFRSSVRSGRVEPLALASAKHLLGTNRLLLDSRAGANPGTRQLLQDLELVLAQITQMRAAGDTSDVKIITEGMDQGDVLSRLRLAVPAGT